MAGRGNKSDLLTQKESSEPKWPRQYAAEIIQMQTKDKRKTALDSVPDHLRQWVKTLVELHYQRRKQQ